MEEIGELVAECHECRAEGDAMSVVGSVQALRSAAVSLSSPAVDEIVESCVAQAISRLCEIAERGVLENDGSLVETACAGVRALGGGDVTSAICRGCRVASARAMREARKNFMMSKKPEFAAALANGLGGCCAAATAASAGIDYVGEDGVRKAAADALSVGSNEGATVLKELSASPLSSESARGAALDASLDEVSFACQFGRRYEKFTATFDYQPTELSAELAVVDGIYVRLEDAYCDACVRDTLKDKDTGLVDVFFYLRKGIDRALSTLSEQAALARLHRTHAALSSEVYTAVQALATAKGEDEEEEEEEGDFARALLAAVDEDEHGASPKALMAACVAGILCRESIQELGNDVVRQLAVSVPAATPLADDFDHLAKQFDDFAAGALDALFDAPVLRAATSRFEREVRHGGGEEDMANLLDRVVLHNPIFLDALKILRTGKPRLALCRQVGRVVADAVLAALLFSRTFDAVAALTLRRESRALQNLIATYLPTDDDDLKDAMSIRPQFAVLTTALDLLNLEAPNDAALVPLKRLGLTAGDLRAVLSRRSDFGKQAIVSAVDSCDLVVPGDPDEGLVYFRV